MSAFGAGLRAIRESRPARASQTQLPHLSQYAVAEAIGVDTGLVCRWERGDRTPLVGNLARIVAALGCSDEEIVRLVRAAVADEAGALGGEAGPECAARGADAA